MTILDIHTGYSRTYTSVLKRKTLLNYCFFSFFLSSVIILQLAVINHILVSADVFNKRYVNLNNTALVHDSRTKKG